MHVEQYIQIAQDEFPYLFDDFGYKPVFTYQGEGRDIGRYSFGLASELYKARILFSTKGGSGLIYLGLHGHFSVVSHLWFEIWNIFEYHYQEKVNWKALEMYRGMDRMHPFFKMISTTLKPHCPEIFEMFSSEDVIDSWEAAYRAYLHEEFIKDPKNRRFFDHSKQKG